MHSNTHSRVLTAAALSLALLPALVRAERIVIPLAEPQRPVELQVTIHQGTVVVEGYSGSEVVLEIDDASGEPDDDEERDDGLRRIPIGATGLVAEADGNKVRISTGWGEDEVSARIQVPTNSSVSAAGMNADEIIVRNVNGDHEIKSANGDIVATGLRGTAVVSTSNGDIKVELDQVTPGKPMSFVSWNGDIELTLPADLAATLHLSVLHGEVYTDFDFQLETTSGTTERDERQGHFKYQRQREVKAAIGGGGPEIQVKSFNGDLYIRKAR